VTTEGRSDIDILWEGAAPHTTRGAVGPRASGARAWFSRAWLQAQLQVQADRWPLWTPVAFGCGCALYFSLPREPVLALLAGLAAATILAAFALRRWGRAKVLAGAVLMLAFGAAGTLAAKIQTLDLAGPIAPAMAGVTVEGCGIMAQTPEGLVGSAFAKPLRSLASSSPSVSEIARPSAPSPPGVSTL
jgi:hypothetical protein